MKSSIFEILRMEPCDIDAKNIGWIESDGAPGCHRSSSTHWTSIGSPIRRRRSPRSRQCLGVLTEKTGILYGKCSNKRRNSNINLNKNLDLYDEYRKTYGKHINFLSRTERFTKKEWALVRMLGSTGPRSSLFEDTIQTIPFIWVSYHFEP